MPTEHKKKKAKKVKNSIIAIKSEPSELHPLEHYVDDKVQLIRQIFGTLKAKTINSITPDFLQNKSHDELQELCLEELLGISKKRLISIINATKCPTDTETSDSDSDVEKIEEHISLEEISSDSNDELNKPKKRKKRLAEVKGTDSDIKKNDTKAETSKNGNPNIGGQKQYSVLELLELQARARAIRSQLALEPVTKIELDDSDDGVVPTISKDSSVAKNPPNNSCNEISKTVEQPIVAIEPEENKEPISKPVRLKRNFRQRQVDDDESTATTVPISTESTIAKNRSRSTSLEKMKEIEPEKEDKDQDVCIQNDDDIIPIIAEPEILCITSSDSENENTKFPIKVKKSYITMPIIEKEQKPPTEDEIFLAKIKQKSSDKTTISQISGIKNSENTENSHNVERKIDDNDVVTSEKVIDASVENASKTEKDVEPLEDGEIIEEEHELCEPNVDLTESSPEDDDSSKLNKNPIENSCEKGNEEKTQLTGTKESDVIEDIVQIKSADNSSSKRSGSGTDNSSDSDESNSNKSDPGTPNEEKIVKNDTNKKPNEEDDDEDIIDLGKDEDLDFDLRNEYDSKSKGRARKTRSQTKAKKGDQPQKSGSKNESWDSRWLRGNKVTKVLATAKLANKVRSNIKEKKTKIAADAQKEEKNELETVPVVENPTNFEVGSVEHYKELTKKKL